MVKKSTIAKTVRLNRLHWLRHVKRMKEIGFPKKF